MSDSSDAVRRIKDHTMRSFQTRGQHLQLLNGKRIELENLKFQGMSLESQMVSMVRALNELGDTSVGTVQGHDPSKVVEKTAQVELAVK
jgi:hypothetical protein